MARAEAEGKHREDLGSEPLAGFAADQLWTLGRSINISGTLCPYWENDPMEVKSS